MADVNVVVALLAALVAMLVAAKAHGRQLRLEREHAGHHEVVFGGENPPFVEALWARDRRRFWSLVAPLTALLAGYALAASGGMAPGPALARSAWGLLAAPLWAMLVGFVAMGLASAARLRKALRAGPPPSPAWAAAARRGGWAWWVLTLAATAAAAALAA